jgi:hypothetical protein
VRVPVGQRWFYEQADSVGTSEPPSAKPPFMDTTPEVEPSLRQEVAAFVDTLLLPLKPRQPWMLDDDTRSDADADADWRLATSQLFGSPDANHPCSATPASLRNLLSAAPPAPTIPFEVLHAYIPGDIGFPLPSVPHLNSKVIRRIFASRESIFKYGIYLPENVEQPRMEQEGQPQGQVIERMKH